MNFDRELHLHSIVRRLCPHCSNLCSAKAKSCPKCGEPLIPLENTSNKKVISKIIKNHSGELRFIRSLEKQIKKPIPLVEKLKKNNVGYEVIDGIITGLSLFKCNLKTIPFEVFNLKFLKKLFLRRNNIYNLPKVIENMKYLEIIDLRINELSELPLSIGFLPKLKVLNLSSNKLFSIPDSIGFLSSLEILNLSNNRLRKIPLSIEKISSLKYLNIKANFWLTLPDSIERLIIKGLKIIR
ncbi:MAG: hypothetical protein ACTSQJ_18115 [Promethearchaeota archaeon]